MGHSYIPQVLNPYPEAPCSFPPLQSPSQQRRPKRSMRNKTATLRNGVGDVLTEKLTLTDCKDQKKKQFQAVLSNFPSPGESLNPSPLPEQALPSATSPVSAVVNSVESKPRQQAASSSPWGGKTWSSLFDPSKSNGVSYITIDEDTEKTPINKNPVCYKMKEYLTNFDLDANTLNIQPRGLKNRSNNCYINAILQALFACSYISNLLTGLAHQVAVKEMWRSTPVIEGMCRFVMELKHLPDNLGNQNSIIYPDTPFEPFHIYKILRRISTNFIRGRQEDAEEFLSCLLNRLNEEMLEIITLEKADCNDKTQTAHISKEHENIVSGTGPFGKTPISNIFGGLLRSKVYKAGKRVTENIQPFFTLPLNITNVKNVSEALEVFVSKNELEDLTPSKTNNKVEALQQMMLDELPMVLVLHLKCFDYSAHGCTKIIKALEFPIDLEIDSKLLTSTKTHQKERQYKLFAVVYHDGWEATKGHYITDAFHVGYNSWLRYDDSSVGVVHEEQVLRPQGSRVPYLLFYRRNHTIESL